MPIGTAVHERTFALRESLNYREWSGYYAVSAYESASRARIQRDPQRVGADRRVAAVQIPRHRQARAAARRSRDHARRAKKLAVGQVYYTPWCDEHGKVIDDGTVTRLDEHDVSLDGGGSEPALVHAERRRPRRPHRGHLANRLPRSRCRARPRHGCCSRSPTPTSSSLKYFRMTRGTIAGVPVEISRTGYTGDLGYEIWMPCGSRRGRVGRADGRRPPVRHPAGRHAGARRRARRGGAAPHRSRFLQQQEGADRGAEVFAVTRWASAASCQLDKAPFVGRARAGRRTSPRPGAANRRPRRRAGPQSKSCTTTSACRRRYPRRRRASRCRSIGTAARSARATTTTWSPVLKKLIALATVDAPHVADGTTLEFEVTVEAVRHRVPAVVVKTPFFNPPRKTGPL